MPKVLLSRNALLKCLHKLKHDTEDDLFEIRVSKGELHIERDILECETKGEGFCYLRAEKLIYLREILKVVHDSPIVLALGSDCLYLSEIYI